MSCRRDVAGDNCKNAPRRPQGPPFLSFLSRISRTQGGRSPTQQMKQPLTLPSSALLLEEANLPADLAQFLAGRSVSVQVLPEEPPCTRPAEPDESEFFIDKNSSHWNAYRPTQVLFTSAGGRSWRLPRSWLAMEYRKDPVDWNDSGAG